VEKYISEEHHKALGLMTEARQILFAALHGPMETREVLAAGLDKLGAAFEFVENPLGEICLCPDCGSYALDRTAEGQNVCLSCDHEWDGARHAEH